MTPTIEKLDTDINRLIDTVESLEMTLKELDSEKNKDGSRVIRLIKDKNNCHKLLSKLRKDRELENDKLLRQNGSDKDAWCEKKRRNRLYNYQRSHYIKEENS